MPVTMVQPLMVAVKPAAPSGMKVSARIAMRSPSANVAATASASTRHEAANPWSVAGRSFETSE